MNVFNTFFLINSILHKYQFSMNNSFKLFSKYGTICYLIFFRLIHFVHLLPT